jgi:hypothetical protein
MSEPDKEPPKVVKEGAMNRLDNWIQKPIRFKFIRRYLFGMGALSTTYYYCKSLSNATSGTGYIVFNMWRAFRGGKNKSDEPEHLAHNMILEVLSQFLSKLSLIALTI